MAGALAAAGVASLSFTATPALLGALAGLTGTAGATLTGNASLRAIGVLAGNILPYTELSPQSLANAVANIFVDKSISGSPDLTLADVLRLLLANAAGKLDIEDIGGGNFRYSYRDPADTKNRIVGTLRSSDGDRTAITTLDGG
jgi:hypothetical protein